jgi:hypothetical protein
MDPKEEQSGKQGVAEDVITITRLDTGGHRAPEPTGETPSDLDVKAQGHGMVRLLSARVWLAF